MKKKIFLNRILHRDRWRILISFKYDAILTSIVRQINGCRYSNTHKGWYVDDNENNIKQILLIIKKEADIDISGLTHDAILKSEVDENQDSELKTHDDKQKCTTDTDNAETIQKSDMYDRDEEIIPTIRTIKKVVEHRRYSPVEFRINEQDGRLAVRFTGNYDKSWIDEIRSFGRYSYDETSKEFLLPWSVMTGDSLSDFFSSRGVEVNIIKSAPGTILKNARREMGTEIRSRGLGEKAIDGLDQMRKYLDEVRYSARTNESYLGLIERPRRSRALPKVFSKEEVKRILNATRNNKHKLLLWMIYSCGLRRSEVTNIRLTDLDRDRGVVHVSRRNLIQVRSPIEDMDVK